jgi:TonB family protein
MSIAVNLAAFGWALSADTLRALRDREQVRQVAVASLTEQDWETNRAVHPTPPRVPSAPEPQRASPRPDRVRPPPAAAPREPAPPPAAAPPSAEPPPEPLPPPVAAAEPEARPPERPTPLAPPEDERRGATPPPPAVTRRPPAPPARAEEPQQVVELGPDAGPEVEPDESQPVVLADRSSRATRNTVAREHQPGAEITADRPRPGSEGKPGEPRSGEEGDARKRVEGEQQGTRGDLRQAQDRDPRDEAGPAKDAIALGPTGELPRAGEGAGTGRAGDPADGASVLGSAEADLTLSPEAIARIARGPEVTVEGAEPGEATALNARRYGEARYIARVTNLPNPYWEKTAVANAAAIEPFLDRPRITEVTFRLDRRGHVSGLRVSESSGVEAIDRLALEVVRDASPYPPLPDELAAKGLTMRMRFRWEPQGIAGVRVLDAAP